MLLVVPNGMVKLMNALPFVAAQLPRDGIAAAWSAYRSAWRSREVADFVAACRADPTTAAPRERYLVAQNPVGTLISR